MITLNYNMSNDEIMEQLLEEHYLTDLVDWYNEVEPEFPIIEDVNLDDYLSHLTPTELIRHGIGLDDGEFLNAWAYSFDGNGWLYNMNETDVNETITERIIEIAELIGYDFEN